MYSDCDSKSGFNYFYWIYICISLICHPHQLHLLPLVASSKFMLSFNRSMSWSSSPSSNYKHYWSVAIDCDLDFQDFQRSSQQWFVNELRIFSHLLFPLKCCFKASTWFEYVVYLLPLKKKCVVWNDNKHLHCNARQIYFRHEIYKLISNQLLWLHFGSQLIQAHYLIDCLDNVLFVAFSCVCVGFQNTNFCCSINHFFVSVYFKVDFYLKFLLPVLSTPHSTHTSISVQNCRS